MLIAPNTTKDKIRRFFTQKVSFKSFFNTTGFWGSLASISGISCYSIYKNDNIIAIIALSMMSLIALYFQYKYYHYQEKVALANSLHQYRHEISEEIRCLDSYFYNLITSKAPDQINEQEIDDATVSHYTQICKILHNAFDLYKIKPSGIFIRALNRKEMSLKTVAKNCTRTSEDTEPLSKNLFARMLIRCLTKNQQLISDFNKKGNCSLPKVPINSNHEIPCLALCNFESKNFPSTLNDILNEYDAKLNNTRKNFELVTALIKRINGNYKSCLGFTISNRGQKADSEEVAEIPVAGFLGIDSQNPHDFEKIDGPFMNFLAGTADALYATINTKTIMVNYAKNKKEKKS